jgi:hypothetical protein
MNVFRPRRFIENQIGYFFSGKKLTEKTFDNRTYGMLDVLTEYAQLDDSLNYLIRIQHGLVDPNSVIKEYAGNINRKVAQFIWGFPINKRNIPNVFSIGSPFIYLQIKNDIKKSHLELVIVPHGGTYNNSGPSGVPVKERHRQSIAYIDDHQGQCEVLLFWHDYLDPEIRKSYTSRGVEVHCAGFPGLPTKGLIRNNVGGQSKFLKRTYEILSRFDRIRIFEPSTAAVYAAYLGLSISFDYEPYIAQLHRECLRLQQDRRQRHFENGLFQSRTMMDLKGEKKSLVAKEILGVSYKQSPERMAHLMNMFVQEK